MKTTQDFRAVCKSINRWARRTRPFAGGRQYGIDWPTWRVCYPQISAVFQQCAKEVAGRDGRFMPLFS